MGNQLEGERWREWFKEWGDRFLLFARQQARRLDEAEDILQEAMVHVWTHRESFATIEPGLVFLQIRRVAINRYRGDARRQHREETYASEYQPLFLDPASPGLGHEVQRALDQLPQDQKDVIVLKVWGDQTFEHIAQALEISPNTAASRYRYGLDHLRRLMKGEMA